MRGCRESRRRAPPARWVRIAGRGQTGGMSPDDLVCAACSGRVSEARCATCRAAREELRSARPVAPEAFLLVAGLALALLLLLALLG